MTGTSEPTRRRAVGRLALQPRLARTSRIYFPPTDPTAAVACSASAGFLKSEDSIPHSLGELDESELTFVEKVVFSALVDDPYKIVLGCAGVGQDSIDLAEN
ncbi:MAG: hypothetical protein NTV05_06805 [Acidobacteria bacterium]|nr:hypothetical protein [Acidobacteriota bacterium]